MTKEVYIVLYEKYIAGRCSAEEVRLLEEYRDAFELTDLPWDEASMGNQHWVKGRIRKRLFRQIGQSGGHWYTYAAAAVLAIGITVIIGLQLQPQLFSGSAAQESPILPGGNKALLTLEDGTEVALDEIDIAQLRKSHGAIHELSDGRLAYSSADVGRNAAYYHTISTPRGGQFRVTLADGTDVWLNASSSIRFPLTFSSDERLVEVTGEVFFDVKRQTDRPFVVQNEQQAIHVLGTSFVVTSYPDEHILQTALLEGKLRVHIGTADYSLAPGERTVYDKRQKLVRKEAFDPEEVIAWKSGYFLFDAEPVENVMRKIARWYDIDIAYEGDMRDKQFSGSISKYDNIQDILDMLALTGTVSFRINGRRVTVME